MRELSPDTFSPPVRALLTVCLAMAMAMVIIDMTVANVALPTISGEMSIPPYLGTWVVTSYTVAEAISLGISGYVANAFGRGRTLVLAISGFCICSLACGAAPNFEILLVTRVAQALCGGQIVPTAQAFIVTMHTKREYGKAVAVVSSIGTMAPVVGPVLGGVITDGLSWRWIFFINVPIAVVGLSIITTHIWPVSISAGSRRVDVIGATLLIGFVASLQIFIDFGELADWLSSLEMTALLLLALLIFGCFLIWELLEPEPILALRLMGNLRYGANTAIFTAIFSVYFANIVITTLWLQGALGYTAAWAGFATAGAGGVGILMLPIVVRLSQMIDRRILISTGCLFSALSFTLRMGWYGDIDIGRVIFAHILMGLSTPFYSVPFTAIILTAVAPNQTNSASSLLYFMRTLGAAIATGIMTALWNYRAALARAKLAGDIDPNASMAQISGLDTTQVLSILAHQIEREASTVSFADTSMLTAATFAIAAAIIWLIPANEIDGG